MIQHGVIFIGALWSYKILKGILLLLEGGSLRFDTVHVGGGIIRWAVPFAFFTKRAYHLFGRHFVVAASIHGRRAAELEPPCVGFSFLLSAATYSGVLCWYAWLRVSVFFFMFGVWCGSFCVCVFGT